LIFPLFSTNTGWQKARPGAGVRVNTVVAEIADPKDLLAQVYVPEIDADGIVAGTRGAMSLDAFPGIRIPGKVRSVAGVPSTPAEREGKKSNDPEDNVRQFEVLFELDELPPQAMPGMTVKVELVPVTKKKVLRVPVDALTSKPLGDGSGGKTKKTRDSAWGGGDSAFVYAKSAGGEWHWQEVSLGARSLVHAEVASGLAEGDKVRTILW
jgi:multidrug efflux pump subunit AcrA (membrane-fusion protein)